jgi:hypothetical protein
VLAASGPLPARIPRAASESRRQSRYGALSLAQNTTCPPSRLRYHPGPATGQIGATSYDAAGDGTVTANGPAVPIGQAAACWLAAG